MDTILSAVLPQLLDLVALILAGLIAAVCLAARQYLTARIGATTTAALSDMLHRALDTGIKAAVAANPTAKPGDMVADAIAHAKASIPDTIAKLAPAPETLVNIARSKLVQVLR